MPKPNDQHRDARLDDLEEDLAEVKERERAEREEQANDRHRFATPEAYEGEMMERREKRGTSADPMKRPTTTRHGNAAHALLDDPTGEERSETEEALERSAKAEPPERRDRR